MTQETPMQPKEKPMYGILGFEQENYGDDAPIAVREVKAVLADADGTTEMFTLSPPDRVESEPSAGSTVEEIGFVYRGDLYGEGTLDVLGVYYDPDAEVWWTEEYGEIDSLEI